MGGDVQDAMLGHASRPGFRSGHRPGPRSGLTLLNAVTLGAVVAVVVLISLPRLHAFAVQENEADAAGLVRRLGQELAAGALLEQEHGATSGAPEVSGPPTPLAHLVSRAGLDARRDDLEWLQDGRVLRRHGYLFELVERGPDGVPWLRAWPWSHGETGRAVFVSTAPGAVLGHPNHAARWSGLSRPPECPQVATADGPADESAHGPGPRRINDAAAVEARPAAAGDPTSQPVAASWRPLP